MFFQKSRAAAGCAGRHGQHCGCRRSLCFCQFSHSIILCCENKESCFAGFSACGGPLQRHLPIRRRAILAEGFYFTGNKVSCEINLPAYSGKGRMNAVPPFLPGSAAEQPATLGTVTESPGLSWGRLRGGLQMFPHKELPAFCSSLCMLSHPTLLFHAFFLQFSQTALLPP